MGRVDACIKRTEVMVELMEAVKAATGADRRAEKGGGSTDRMDRGAMWYPPGDGGFGGPDGFGHG